jgi:hypothetical protein
MKRGFVKIMMKRGDEVEINKKYAQLLNLPTIGIIVEVTDFCDYMVLQFANGTCSIIDPAFIVSWKSRDVATIVVELK